MTKHKKNECIVRTKAQQYQHNQYLLRKGKEKEVPEGTSRICLKHGGYFNSLSLHNRVCPDCKGKTIQAFYSGKTISNIEIEQEDFMSPVI